LTRSRMRSRSNSVGPAAHFLMRRVLRYVSLGLERRGDLDVALARLLSSCVALGGCRSRECGFGCRLGGVNQSSEKSLEHVGDASFVATHGRFPCGVPADYIDGDWGNMWATKTGERIAVTGACYVALSSSKRSDRYHSLFGQHRE
jgi:hypothetical protein